MNKPATPPNQLGRNSLSTKKSIYLLLLFMKQQEVFFCIYVSKKYHKNIVLKSYIKKNIFKSPSFLVKKRREIGLNKHPTLNPLKARGLATGQYKKFNALQLTRIYSYETEHISLFQIIREVMNTVYLIQETMTFLRLRHFLIYKVIVIDFFPKNITK